MALSPEAISAHRSTIRPIGAYALSGLAVAGQTLWAVDQLRGYLLEIEPESEQATVRNSLQVESWLDATGLAIRDDMFWFARGQKVFSGNLEEGDLLQMLVQSPYDIDGVALAGSTLYVSSQKAGYIRLYDAVSGEEGAKLPLPGVGRASLTFHGNALWVCDRDEQTAYCLDPDTGEIRFSALTPFASPTGIAFYHHEGEPEPTCYVSYADEEPYVRDDPNSEDPFQLTFRDRTFIHPLYFHHDAEQHYTRSNGYLVEMSYAEELLPLDAVMLNDVEWRIALPSNTARQRLRSVEPIGQPFEIEEQEGQQVAVFKLGQLQPDQAGIFGWRAVVEMYGLKYSLTPRDVEDAPELSSAFQQRYLVDDDELAMDHPKIIAAAKEAVGTETNVLRKMLKIRNYVYDRLSYGIQPKIDTPEVALERGVGSCGEYVGLLLALARLNGIACRTIGRYKCPQKPELRQVPLEPEFNHVWLEFYVPGVGWLPMESNVDDVVERGPYPQRFFMGLAWYHMELGKGISFEKMKAMDKPEDLKKGDLAINHIRFRVLDELVPTTPQASTPLSQRAEAGAETATAENEAAQENATQAEPSKSTVKRSAKVRGKRKRARAKA